MSNVFGLANYGLTCWFNSAIQTLLSSDAFLTTCKEVQNNAIASTFVAIYDSRGDAKHLHRLYECYKKHHPASSHGQQDSHEGLTNFMDMVGAAINKVFTHDYKIYIKCRDCHYKTAPTHNQNFYITIPLTTDDIGAYVYRHINKIDADFRCTKCARTNCEQIYQLSFAPKVILLLFPKYGDKCLVKFPKTFSIKSTPQPLTYKVIAQIEHFGGMSGGHYVAFGKRGHEEFLFNDSSVQKYAMLPTANTYLVAYER